MSDYVCGGVCPPDGGCVGESKAQLCALAAYSCGTLGVNDRCGVKRLVECGSCEDGGACQIDDDVSDSGFKANCGPCVPEDDAALCNRKGANCGPLPLAGAGLVDNCGAPRTVECGSCLDPDGADACGLSHQSQCFCQPLLSGCEAKAQCCSGAICRQGLCCLPTGQECGDDSDCCEGACAARLDGGSGAECSLVVNAR